MTAASSVRIVIGGATRTFSVGDSVTPAELVAIEQVQTKTGQTIVLDGRGRADGGTFSLNSVTASTTGYTVASIVVPKSVTALDRVTANSSIDLSGDLINYGSILEVGKGSTAAGANPAVNISAQDIVNQSSGLIATKSTGGEIDLGLSAAYNFTNMGTINSSGSLAISAGNSLTNIAGTEKNANTPSLIAAKDVSLQSSTISNGGLIAATTGNINLSAPGAQNMTLTNTGGTLNAANAINVRDGSYTGAGNTTITGGNLLSQQLNLNAGTGTVNVDVDNLTGTVSSTGNAVHVNANTETLTLGAQTLSGDPTFYNAGGDIQLTGTVNVSEQLAIVASGNITATNGCAFIVAQDASGNGYNINLVAGANVATSGSGADSTTTVPGTKATSSVSFTGASATGGNIDLSGADPALSISSASTSAGSSGNITLAAYSNVGGNGGRVLLPSGSNIDASSQNGNFGNVTILAGSTSAGTAVSLGSVQIGGGGAPGAANLYIFNNQPATSDGHKIVFNTDGSIGSGNTLVPGTTLGAGDIVLNGSTWVQNNLVASAGGGVVFSGANNNFFENGLLVSAAGGDIQFNGSNMNIVAATNGVTMIARNDILTGAGGGGSITAVAPFNGSAGNVTMIAGANYTLNTSTLVISALASSVAGGNINLSSGALTKVGSFGLSNAEPSGQVTLVAFDGGAGTGTVVLSNLATISSVSTGGGPTALGISWWWQDITKAVAML